MSSLNRGRYTIATDGPWRLYTQPMQGWTMLGTVQRQMEIGALGRSREGVYAQINGRVIESLDQRKVMAAIGSVLNLI